MTGFDIFALAVQAVMTALLGFCARELLWCDRVSGRRSYPAWTVYALAVVLTALGWAVLVYGMWKR